MKTFLNQPENWGNETPSTESVNAGQQSTENTSVEIDLNKARIEAKIAEIKAKIQK